MREFMIGLLASINLWAGAGQGQTFGGYPCTVDCSGHEAGYNWAIENGITDASECTGNSNSFIEGCMVAVDEASDAAASEDEQSDDYPTEDPGD